MRKMEPIRMQLADINTKTKITKEKDKCLVGGNI